MINDRGTKKWTSIMMPEHIRMLQEFFNEEEKVEKPILDEQELEEINFTLNEAIENNLTVQISYYIDGGFKDVVGKINNINAHNRHLWIDDNKVKLDDIVSASIK